MFKVKLFGVMEMKVLTKEEKATHGSGEARMALRVEKLSLQWGGMNQDVHQAGLKEGDVVVQVDERQDLPNHSELLAYLIQEKASGEKLAPNVLRSAEWRNLEIPLRWDERTRP